MTRYNTTHSPALEGCRDRVTALEAENARLREALSGLYQALRERHHGRMPDDVRVAYEQAAAALAGEERDLAAENRAAIAEQEHGRREA